MAAGLALVAMGTFLVWFTPGAARARRDLLPGLETEEANRLVGFLVAGLAIAGGLFLIGRAIWG